MEIKTLQQEIAPTSPSTSGHDGLSQGRLAEGKSGERESRLPVTAPLCPSAQTLPSVQRRVQPTVSSP